MSDVYIRVFNGLIIDVNSNDFLSDNEGWIKIDSGNGDKFKHAQGNYFTGGLFDDNGIPRYAYADGAISFRDSSAIKADLEKIVSELPKKITDRIANLEKALNTINTLLAKLGMK